MNFSKNIKLLKTSSRILGYKMEKYIEEAIELNKELNILNSRQIQLTLQNRNKKDKSELERINDEFYDMSFKFYQTSLRLLELYKKMKLDLSSDLKTNLEVVIDETEINIEEIAEKLNQFDE